MKKIISSPRILLLLILILAGILRFFKLGEIPPSLSWDEVAQGYNAYSLGTTGKDEFGRFLPLDYLESFGDFKPVLYTYMAIVPVKIWGLNEFSTRFPSAFFGTLTVLLSYYLVKEMFFKNENKNTLALLTSFFMAISPWHLQMSRVAFEANLGLFLVVLGTYLFLRGLNGGKTSLFLSALPFAATFYTFNSTRAFVPIFLVGLVLLFFKEGKKLWKQGFFFAIFFLLLLLPIIPHLLSPQANLRFREVNIFSDLKPIELSNARIAIDQDSWWSRILHNRRWMFTTELLRHYTDNLNLNFLFLHGDINPKFSIQDVGHLYLIDLPFFIAGLFFLLKKYPEQAKLIFLWLLVGLIPAATARETPHALRILQTLPTWQIILAIGWLELFLWSKNNTLKKGGTAILATVLVLNFFWYLHHYYGHYPKEFASEWQYGYKEAINYLNSQYDNYERITFTDNLGRPYIYFLFYNQYSPNKFRQTAVIERNAFGFVNVKSFDKYVFGGLDLLQTHRDKKTLSVVSPQDLPKDKKPLKDIFLPDGKIILRVYEN